MAISKHHLIPVALQLVPMRNPLNIYLSMVLEQRLRLMTCDEGEGGMDFEVTPMTKHDLAYACIHSSIE